MCANRLLSDRPNPIANHLNLLRFLWHFLPFSHCPLSIVSRVNRVNTQNSFPHLCPHAHLLSELAAGVRENRPIPALFPHSAPSAVRPQTSPLRTPTLFNDLGNQTKACNTRSCPPPNLMWRPSSAPNLDKCHLRVACLPSFMIDCRFQFDPSWPCIQACRSCHRPPTRGQMDSPRLL
jgi:hypothetical protein